LWRAWVASLTVTLLAIAPLLAIFHQISARHAVCEHGQLVESGHEGLDVATIIEALAEGSRDDLQTAVDVDSDSAEHGHRHCSVGTLVRSSAVACAAPEVLAELLSRAAPSPRRVDSPIVRPVLLSAPKTSPPAISAPISA
jgi:hypothetical protein